MTDRKPPRRLHKVCSGQATIRSRRACALAAIACALAIAACGPASKPRRASAQAHAELAFSECMRQHGVQNYPDPPAGGGGVNLAGINIFSPAYNAAAATCTKLHPVGGPPAGKPSEQMVRQMVATAECMRHHGVSGFPDPIHGTPPGNINEYPAVLGYGFGPVAVWLLVPRTIDVNSPAFKQAAKACSFH